VPSDKPAKNAGKDNQVLEQMWFPGVHSNIGGGYAKHGLSDASFLWMLSRLKGKLALDPDCVGRALDPCKKEYFPAGTLEESRKGFWRVAFCAVPRPVCVISDTEHIHDSVWLRNEATKYVPADDLYKKPRRKVWIDGMKPRRIKRAKEEKDMANLARTELAPLGIRRKLDFCSRVLEFIGGRN
jgi:T6SS, Phospholipase effector Tle1-like, catalytic domain